MGIILDKPIQMEVQSCWTGEYGKLVGCCSRCTHLQPRHCTFSLLYNSCCKQDPWSWLPDWNIEEMVEVEMGVGVDTAWQS